MNIESLIGYVGVPEPFNKVLRVVVALVAVLIVISLLLGLLGHPIFNIAPARVR